MTAASERYRDARTSAIALLARGERVPTGLEHELAAMAQRASIELLGELVVTADLREDIARSRGDVREHVTLTRADLYERSGCARPMARRKPSAQRRARAMVCARAPPHDGVFARPLAEPALLEELAMPALHHRRRRDAISTPTAALLDSRFMLHTPSKPSLGARRSAKGAEVHLDARGWPAIVAVVVLAAVMALVRRFL